MSKLTKTLVIAIAAVGLSLGGCKKKEEKAAEPKPTTPTPTTPTPTTPTPTTPTPPPADPVPVSTDTFKVTADHVDPAKGKVEVVFGKLTVKAAKFDPKNLEGGTAEIEVDVTSLSSGIGDRDKHLQSPDYLDAVKFPVITVKVDNVKKAGSDTSFTADATVNAHGVEKKIPLKFDVTGQTDDSVTVKVNHTFSRKDFAVGGPGDAKDSVKMDLVLDATLTLKNT